MTTWRLLWLVIGQNLHRDHQSTAIALVRSWLDASAKSYSRDLDLGRSPVEKQTSLSADCGMFFEEVLISGSPTEPIRDSERPPNSVSSQSWLLESKQSFIEDAITIRTISLTLILQEQAVVEGQEGLEEEDRGSLLSQG